ncbi:CCR4-NOT transcription complex subunit 7 isoform X1 [Papilio machaon]|uniref:CCR4-NOT transcription complex subunit 7 isoform X1 n=2 Tax=Papilio machaon TaxID=76193 RepID=UPI0006EB1445|nr:CCR4-NOT transcription complex subunit 7 isoform X1 [Papilio machaon]
MDLRRGYFSYHYSAQAPIYYHPLFSADMQAVNFVPMSQPPPPPPPPPPPSSQAIDDCGIKDVWNYNLHEEFHIIRQIVQKYHWVAMDTEFPGVVARPIGEFRSTADYQYQLLRCNVDLLRIIQLGLTFMDENGQTPSGYTTWQFNFKFSLQEDMYAQDSIDLLQNSGLQFRKHEEEGIDPLEFAELIMTSGLVLMDNIKWLSFHSGYDFGYLLKLLTDQNLPSEENDFFQSLRMYFPTIYDVKYLMKLCKNLKGGLQEVADQLELRRVGPQHQAGSDSHLTGMAFFKIKEIFFDDNIENSSGHLYGLGAPFSATANNFPDGGDGKPS